MADFSIVLFEPDDIVNKGPVYRLLFRIGVFKSGLCTRLFLSAKRRVILAGIKRTTLFDDLNAWVFKLPLTITSLPGFCKNALRDYIVKLCAQSGAQKCIMPQEACIYNEFGSFKAGHYSRELIYKAHLEYILEDIYESRGIRLASLDTVIVGGADDWELSSFVQRLEPHFRYLTVAAAMNSGLEEELAGISAETGLMINITDSWKTALKNADLIINLAGAAAISGYRFKPASLVINFNNADDARVSGEYTAINGVEYLLPAGVFTELGADVLRRFSRRIITDAVMDIGLECGPGQTPDNIGRENILGVFGKFGCAISGYTGRRGAIRAEDLLKSPGIRHLAGKGY